MNYLENYFDLSKFPKSTTEIVIKRLKKGMMMESEFAELIKERSLIEERYSNDLLKLNKKISQVDSEFVGPLENIFENVLKKNIEKSTIRKNFCKEILENLEKPLKSLNNFENFKFFEQESLKYLKDFELKNLKYLKHLKKKKSDNKLPALKLAMEQSKQTWQNESQKIFDSFFQMDENRIDFFKEILMKYITMDSNISQTEFTELQNLYIEIVSLESKFDILEFCKQNGNKGNADIKNEIGSSLSELESPSRRDSIRDSIKSFQRPSFGAKHHNVVSSQENIVASPQNDSERKIEEKDNFNNNLTQDARVQKEQENFSAYHIDSLKQNEVINEQTVQIVGIHNKHPQNVEEEQIGNQECNQRVQKDLNINPQSQFQHTDTHFGYNAQQQNGQQQNYHVEESINEVFQHEQNNQILKNMMVSSSPKVMENSGSVHTISDEGSEFKQTSPIKIDIKNYPIVEDEAAARNAMDLIASVLKPPTVNSVATARRRTTSQNRAQSVENPLLNSAFSIPVTQRSLSTNSPIFSHNPFLNSNQISQENVQENFEPYSSENKVTEVSISLNVNEQISILFNENNLIKVLLTGE
ncbi:hypothetical protein HK099_005944 [Clydaea vesicula]|uniref:FCH domain-containing protein n=1 Tax=Clydaea vesicula TaxID=447962 RepID=A0AAD5TYQ8_9FUNG|nr:hypothetical protein HK099_005944 [Clydaea vesicula]